MTDKNNITEEELKKVNNKEEKNQETDGNVLDEVNKEKGEEKKASKKENVKKESKVVKKKRGGKIRRQITRGKVFINSTYNNTCILMTDIHGNALAWSTAGLLGFKGAKKATTYAANQVILDISDKVSKYGLKELEVFIKGVGSGREAAIRALSQKGFSINLIEDRTPIPHNGCRPAKPRRV